MLRAAPVLLLFLLAPALAPAAASAASFPCAKAATPTEKAICADPGLSNLDGRLAPAYREALSQLSGADPDESPVQKALKADQRAWLAERNACGADAGCLRTSYERRLAVLTFRPDPGLPGRPADRFVGRFEHKGFIELVALALRSGDLAVTVSGAEPQQARWTCHFSEIGRLDPQGRLVVGTPGPEGEGLILEAKGSSAVDIAESDENMAASANYCGRNGRFAFTYRRKS